jgi:transcriptional regulator
MLRGIVAFSMPVERIEGKFKLSQNRSRADQEGVVRHLEQDADADGLRLASLMRRHLDLGTV